jgi:hypothetical protein
MTEFTISQLIAVLQAALVEHGDLECVYEQWGYLSPCVHVVSGRKVMDLVGD